MHSGNLMRGKMFEIFRIELLENDSVHFMFRGNMESHKYLTCRFSREENFLRLLIKFLP